MSFRDVYTFYVEPDDDYCDHGETEEQADGVYCLRCGANLGTPEDLYDYEYEAAIADAQAKEGTAECRHLYMMPNYEGKWHCSACDWTEGEEVNHAS